MAEDTRVPPSSTAAAQAPKAIEDITFDQIRRLNKEDARSYLTWSNFFSALTAGPDVKQRYLGVRDIVREEEDCKRCDEWKESLFQSSPIIRFLQDEISAIGPRLSPAHVRCRRCDIQAGQGGGFNQDYGILVCANEVKNKAHLEDTIAHEMVHAYDHSRFKVDAANMRHQACTEIRAAALSGECRFTNEFFKKNQWKITQHLQDCVKRRATLSMLARPQIGGDDVKAAKVVNEVFDSCFNDTRPFDEIFR